MTENKTIGDAELTDEEVAMRYLSDCNRAMELLDERDKAAARIKEVDEELDLLKKYIAQYGMVFSDFEFDDEGYFKFTKNGEQVILKRTVDDDNFYKYEFHKKSDLIKQMKRVDRFNKIDENVYQMLKLLEKEDE